MQCRPACIGERFDDRHAQKGPMDCTICGKATMPGAMLCAPCKAALKRARYVTVQEDLRRPSIIDRRRPAPRQSSAVPSSSPPAQAPVPTDSAANASLGRRIFTGIFVLAAVLGGASYFGQRALGFHAADDAMTSVAPSQVPARVESTAATPQPTATPMSPSPSDAIAAKGTDTAEPAPPPAKPVAVHPSKKSTLFDQGSFATANGDPPDAVPVAPAPEKIVMAPVPPPPPPPDRWQSMRDALAQCDREGLFGGIVCGQKVRIQFCEGYWGKMPQCPGPAANPER
jgi:hypothetical protein